MKYIAQFCRIVAIAFISEICHSILPLPIPASIYGIIIMFGLLVSGWMPLEKVKETGKFLVEIMPVMFIPAAVGLMKSWEDIKPSLFAYAIVTVVSTLTVMGVSGVVTQQVIRREKKKEDA